MSGGFFDYENYKLDQWADQIELECEFRLENRYGVTSEEVWRRDFPAERERLYRAFAAHLRVVSKALHEIDWTLSDDTSWPRERASIEQALAMKGEADA